MSRCTSVFNTCILICGDLFTARNFDPLPKRHFDRDAMISARQLGKRCQHVRVFNPRWHWRALSLLSFRPRGPVSRTPSFSSPVLILRRNAGTKIRKLIDELPQGLQAPLEPFVEREASRYSPVIDEVLQNQRRFPKCVLLTRVGQFYEVYHSLRSLTVVILHSGRGNCAIIEH